MIRLHGMAERANSPEQPLGPDVIVPTSVPVTVESLNHQVGVATLHRDEQGDIWADAEITNGAALKDFPYFAVDIRSPAISKSDDPMGTITSGEIIRLVIVRRNLDPDLAPYEVVGG